MLGLVPKVHGVALPAIEGHPFDTSALSFSRLAHLRMGLSSVELQALLLADSEKADPTPVEAVWAGPNEHANYLGH